MKIFFYTLKKGKLTYFFVQVPQKSQKETFNPLGVAERHS